MAYRLDTKIPSKYLFIPVLYIFLILAMLYLQFGKAIPFSDSYRGIDISGRRNTGSGERGISEIGFQYGEFSFYFGPSHSLTLHDDKGTSAYSLHGYAKFPDRLELRFSDDLVLTLVNDSGSFILKAVSETQAQGSIHIPFLLHNLSEFSWADGFPVIQHTSRRTGTGYFIALPAGSHIDFSAGLMEINPAPDGTLLAIENSGESSIISYWFSRQPVKVSETQFRRGITAYIEKSYHGWKTTRYNSATGTWKGNSGSIFSADILNAYACEAFSRNEGISFLSRIIPAVYSRPDLNYVSNPYTGNIVDTYSSMMADMEKLTEIIQPERSLSLSDMQLLERFISVVPSARKSRLKTILEDTLTKKTAETSAGFTQSIHIYRRLFAEDDSISIVKGIEESILPRITPYRDGYIFESLNGVSDSHTGIVTGLTLAGLEENDFYRQIGRNLLLTYLAMADAAGRIPRELIKKDASWSVSTEYLLPEEIYGLLSPNDYMPRVYPLDSGMWAWGCATQLNSVARGNQIVISSTFPVNSAHHLTITGVEPFSSITLFGIPWKNDPQFQRYSSGWSYNVTTKTLFIKITQRRSVESIVIDYSPSVSAPVTESTTEPEGFFPGSQN